MKRIISILVFLSVVSISNSAVNIEVKPPLKASEVYLSVGNTGKMISLFDLSKISLKDFNKLIGRNMKLFERIGFKLAQKKLRNSINTDGTFNKKQVDKFLRKAPQRGDPALTGLLLGSFLGPIGVLIAYLINDDKKKQRTNWAWIGLVINVISFILAFFVL